MSNDEKQEAEKTQPERLYEVLGSLEHLIKKQTSLKFAFVKGIVYGVGTVVGATILISILSYLFIQLFGAPLGEITSSEEIYNTLTR